MCVCVFIPFTIFALLFSHSPVYIVVTQIRGDIRIITTGSSPLSPLRFVPAILIARRLLTALSSLVDSRRNAPTHATWSLSALDPLYVCKHVQNPSTTEGFKIQDKHWVTGPIAVDHRGDRYLTNKVRVRVRVGLPKVANTHSIGQGIHYDRLNQPRVFPSHSVNLESFLGFHPHKQYR